MMFFVKLFFIFMAVGALVGALTAEALYRVADHRYTTAFRRK